MKKNGSSRSVKATMPSLREINVYNAESLEGVHGGYFYEEKDGKMRMAFTICPNLKNINLYYNETNDAGEVVVHREYGSPSSRTKYYVPYFGQCYGGEVYDSKTYTPVSSDTSVAKIISTGRVNEWEAASAGTITKSFEIDPGPVIAKSVVIGKKKSVITVNADKQADGYQIYYSSKKSKGYKKLYSGKDLKAEVSGLKSGMYIKVRTYKKVGKTTYYSEWSAPVQVK